MTNQRTPDQTPASTGKENSRKMQHDQSGEFDFGVEGGQQDFSQDRTQGTQDNTRGKAGEKKPVGATSSANSSSADPSERHKSLDQPVSEVTRHI